MNILKTFKSNISFLLLILLCTFPLMIFHIQSKVIISWVVLSGVLMYKSVKLSFRNKNIKIYLINVAWVLWMLISLIYSSNTMNGLKEFEKIISVLIIPFVIFFIMKKIKKQQRYYLFLTFTLTMFCYSVFMYSFLASFLKNHYASFYLKNNEPFNLLHYLGYLLKASRTYLYGYGGDLKFPIFYHKSYYSLSLLFSICFLVKNIFIKNKIKIACFSIMLVFFVFMLFVHLSKIHIALLMFFIVFLFVYLFIRKKIKLSLYTKLILSVLIFSSVLGYLGFLLIANNFGDSFLSRNKINTCSFELIKDKPILGYGYGGVEEELISCYSEKLIEDNAYKRPFMEAQNTHNYYIYIYLSSGLIGIFLFFLFFYYNGKLALQNNDIFYLIFLIIFGFTLLFENSLSRIYGVLFFSIFNSVFLQKYIYIK